MGGPPSATPRRWKDAASCVDALLEELGPRIVVGAPIGLGKPVQTLNELYARALRDPRLELTLITGLTLTRPRARGELERRLLEPFVARVFGGTPEPAWEEARRADRLPPNVRVIEFYMQPGALLASAAAQRDYVSSNYTHVTRDALARGLDLFVQTVSARADRDTLSLSANADLAPEVIPALHARRPRGLAVADVNPRLPFMHGAAEVGTSTFDHVIHAEEHATPLFGTPHEPVTTTDWAIALHASALIRDGGTLQLGIGSLADAVCYLLALRHEDNARWRALLAELGGPEPALIESVGGLGPFDEGLYAATEMLVAGYLVLHRCGVLERRVWPWAALQALANAGRVGRTPDRGVLEALRDAGAVGSPLAAHDVEELVACGVLREGTRLAGEELVLEGGARAPADLRDPRTLALLEREGLGAGYRGGRVAHAAFFLGPRAFYDELAALPDEQRELFEMTGIGRVNQLYGHEQLARLQCRDARFVNSALTVSLLGAAASDTLADGRVVSGVGGQHDLVVKAHALAGARSILLVRSTRASGGRTTSNVVAACVNATLPRHLRDLVVSEYGVADLRGRTDGECCAATIAIADARFQPGLVAAARAAGKLPRGWTVPERSRHNLPERLHGLVDRSRAEGTLPRFPLGTDLDPEELVLARCLKATAQRVAARRPRLPGPRALASILAPPDAARPLLERMQLERPRNLRERRLRLALLYSLVTEGGLAPPLGRHA